MERNKLLRAWKIRKDLPGDEPFSPERTYEGYDNWFSFKIHHDGVFRNFPGRRYAYGRHTFVDYVDIEKFFVHEIDYMLEKINAVGDNIVLYYHFQIPGKDLDTGLAGLSNDADVIHLGKYVVEHKVINMFIEHGQTKVPYDSVSPYSSKVVIEELHDVGGNANTNAIRKRSASKKLLLEWIEAGECSNEHHATHVNKEVAKEVDHSNRGETEVVEAAKDVWEAAKEVAEAAREVEASDIAKEVIEVAKDVVEAAKEVTDSSAIQPGFDYDFDNGDFSKDFPLSETGESESESKSEATDSQDSDYIVDLDNEADEVDVDMREFKEYVDSEEEFIESINESVGNHEGNCIDEVLVGETLSNESFDSLNDDSMDEFESKRSKKAKGSEKQEEE